MQDYRVFIEQEDYFFEGGIKDRARVVATIGATIVAPEIYLYYGNKDLKTIQRVR